MTVREWAGIHLFKDYVDFQNIMMCIPGVIPFIHDWEVIIHHISIDMDDGFFMARPDFYNLTDTGLPGKVFFMDPAA